MSTITKKFKFISLIIYWYLKTNIVTLFTFKAELVEVFVLDQLIHKMLSKLEQEI